MTFHRALGFVDRSALTDDSPLRVVMASEGRMADKIDLRMSGADLARFRGNPVLGYGHSYWGRTNLPIGRVDPDTLMIADRQLSGEIQFDQGDEFAREVERKMRAGYLNAVSIGFDVTQWESAEDSYWRGGVATKWELSELSVVPVPMDASALVTSGRSAPGEDDDILPAVLRYLGEELTRRGLLPLPNLGEALHSPTEDTPQPSAQRVTTGERDSFVGNIRIEIKERHA
jgi:HK97 family phage prohead protease